MSTTILPIRGPSFPTIEALPSVKPAGSGGASTSSSFADLISTTVDTVEKSTRNATDAAQRFLSGENEDLHKVATAEQRAKLPPDLSLKVRNKAISAYQEIMKMQL